MSYQDKLLRFSFDRLDIRGELVYLDQSWETILSRYPYPEPVRKQLGSALAAVSLLSASVKFEGTMILQIRSKGPLRSLVTQITSSGNLRGIAKWQGEVPDGKLKDVFGEGQMLISVIKDDGERYQSIVSLDGDSLPEALNAYFVQSEQLPSTFQLFVTDTRVAGFFLQALPENTQRKNQEEQVLIHSAKSPRERDREEDWNRINFLAATLQQDELFSLTPERLLTNLFHEEQVRVFEPKPLRFSCTCSREKVERTLIALGPEELASILQEEGTIKVDCEFCNTHYEFSAKDVDNFGNDPIQLEPGTVLH
ncbi:MAG: Hsp33 family molecular chaperone HslO [Pseudomonadota bacterium]